MTLDLALRIAQTGLAHVNRQLGQSASNIANAATTGYTRKAVEGTSASPGSLLAGVRSLEATRAVDTALVTQLNATRATTAAATARARILEGVEIAHGGAGQSVGDLTAALQDSFVSLRGDPSDALLQAQVVQSAQALADRYGTVSTAIRTARQAAQDAMVQDVQNANAALARIGDLTDRIVPLRAQGISTVELEDGRDKAVADLSSILQLRAIEQGDGNLTLVTAGGLSLPLRERTGPFSMGTATLGPQAYHGAGGTLPGVMLGSTDVTANLGNGTLAAHAELRDRLLPLAQAELDVSAATLATRMSAQGLRLFTAPDGTVRDPAAPYAPGNWLGFAGTMRVNAAIQSDTRLLRDGTHAVAAAAGGPTAFTPNAATGPASFTTLLDRVLAYAMGAEASPGNAHAAFVASGLGPDGTLSSSLRTARSVSDHATALVASQTGLRSQASEEGTRSADLLAALEARFADRSGVDMDKELSAMIALQTTYSANARLISMVQSLYDALFQVVR